MSPATGRRTDDAALRAELERLRTADAVLEPATSHATAIVGNALERRGLQRPAILVVDYSSASPALRSSRYWTDGAKALARHSIVVVNARFLLEIEATLRTFEQAWELIAIPQLRGDDAMFGLVRRLRDNLDSELRRLRRTDERRARAQPVADTVPAQLALALAFFLAHEAGHLRDALDDRSFSSFVRPGAPLETRVAGAVVKLCRHVEDLAAAGFDLPGGGAVLDRRSELRRREQELRADVDEADLVNHAAWFEEERAADRWGAEILVDHLAQLAENDPVAAEGERNLLVKGVFGAAMHSWFRDLMTFGEKLPHGGLADSRSLALAFAMDRMRYVNAAELFGDIHRFTLLRATLMIEEVLSPTGVFDRPEAERGMWAGGPAADSLQRYVLLCILMDTAVKLATIGCATGWMLDVDRARGTEQIFVITFESVAAAVERLRGRP